MTKTVKKIMILGIVTLFFLLFSLSACGYPIDKFDSLEEMQAVLPKDMYYFDFEQEGIKEAGKFEATKVDKDSGYFRYSVWYDVEYEIGGQKQERKLGVIATDVTRPMSFGYKQTMPFSSNLASTIEPMEIIVIKSGLLFDENKNTLFLDLVIKDHNFFYYFILEGVPVSLVEEEVETFLSMWSFAITNKHQIS